MDRKQPVVKRSYDAAGRRAQADRTREALVETARDLLLRDGYAATTVARVAALGGVSAESVYKRFGGKPGLVRAVVHSALRGTAVDPAEARSDALAATDPRELIRAWARLTIEIAPAVAPLLLIVHAGAGHDPALASLAAELDEARRARMTVSAHRLAAPGHLRPGVTVEHAADVLWTYSSPELYDLLVLRSRWDLPSYAAFVAEGIASQLLAAA